MMVILGCGSLDVIFADIFIYLGLKPVFRDNHLIQGSLPLLPSRRLLLEGADLRLCNGLNV